jgi:D-alanyl-D-alanine carboxypeptidase
MSNDLRARPRALARALFVAIQAVVLVAAGSAADAAHRHGHVFRHSHRAPIRLAADPGKDAALIVDGNNGKVLYARNADALRHPASLTKMMTLYLLFDALKQGKVTMGSQLTVSQHAAEQHPTNLHLWAGDQINVDTAIKAIVVRSANDVAVAIAENLGGTESHFAEMMTAKAREFGMRSTYYHNASGLPDNLQITTASDLAILAHHLAYDYPQYFPYFATPGFYFRGTYYPTHDNLIGRYDGADGIKTGYTEASGFNLVSSVVRGGAHVIGVVLGGPTAHTRDREMVDLLDQTFDRINDNPTLVARAQIPWQQVASTAPPASTGFTPAPQANTQIALTAPQPAYANAQSADEDTAEAQTNEGNVDLTPETDVAPLPKPATTAPAHQPTIAMLIQQTTPPPAAAPARKPAASPAIAAPAVRPAPKPFVKQETPVAVAEQQPQPQPKQPQAHAPIVIAAYHAPHELPKPKPAAHTEIGEGDISFDRVGSTTAAINKGDWTIQIGAFANAAQAQAQLASYAEKSMDVLGQASRNVAPFKAVDGKTMYRARFGPFPEREARNVCTRLASRGQTCFAIVAQ